MNDLALRVRDGSLNVATMHDVLRERAYRDAGATAVSFLPYSRHGVQQNLMTYGELDRRARAIAVRLSQLCKPGERAVLVYESGLDFVEAFFGCLYAGVIAVPLAPPRSRVQDRLAGIARNCGARVLLCAHPAIEAVTIGQVVSHTLITAEISDYFADTFEARPNNSADAIAFLQYTSGSTGDPKGVIVTHRALLANLEQIRRSFRQDPTCVCVNWLPLHHDMGLIGTVLLPIYTGFPTHLMSPLTFIQHPEYWLNAIGALGGTTGGGPAFGYRHCVDRIRESDRAQFDLHSWRVAFCGGEPIQAATLRRFADAFGSAGFRSGCFMPCYGLAEATLFVSSATYGNGATLRNFSAEALDHGRAEPVATGMADTATARELVGCGLCGIGTEVVIGDALGHSCAAGLIGEIYISGPSLGAGYWSNEKATLATFIAQGSSTGARKLLRTGDLGFLSDGELFVTGRIKDIVIIDGRNIAPSDLEWCAVEEHERVSAAAAFSIEDEAGERAVLLIEVSGRPDSAELDGIVRSVRHAVGAHHGIALAAVNAVRAASLPRTTSGKISRTRCKISYLQGELDSL